MKFSDAQHEMVTELYSEEQIAQRVSELAAELDARYAGTDVLLVAVLKGAVVFVADLLRALSIDAPIDFMAVSSYGAGTETTGVVRIVKDLDTDIAGRHVVIVEDIVDTGLTLTWLIENLRLRGPASIAVCAMFRKPEAARVPVAVDLVGFDLPTQFVVGYGLDYAEQYRGMRSLGVLAPPA
jgi:hypoxanthine phosphoribosyltransferase